jgi:hypothetical protein
MSLVSKKLYQSKPNNNKGVITMQKPQTVNGMNKEQYFWFRNHCTLSRFVEGWVPETEEELEYEWRRGLKYEAYLAAKEKDKPKRYAEFEEYVRNNPRPPRAHGGCL